MESLVISSPFGALELRSQNEKLTHVLKTKKRVSANPPQCPTLKKAKKQLAEYFSGKRTQFDLPLQLEGTDFQKRVWKQLQNIPFGQSLTYSSVAEKIKSPKAFRAVGTACGKNNLLVIVPCHRVKAQNGLGGFALGLEVKRELLRLENNGATINN